MLEIIPSILTNNPQELRELMGKAEGLVERVQIDIVDGVFADNRTIDPLALREVESNLKLDFHLMVKEPINWVEKCASAGAEKQSLRPGDLRIIGHIEQMESQVEFVGKVQEVGAAIGLAIDLETKVTRLDETILDNLDVILVMSVAAGFGGQKFEPKTLGKIRELNEVKTRNEALYRICIDGGVTIDNIGKVVKNGVEEVAIGRRLFEGDIQKNIEKFKKSAHG
jgi:ribulose-phosphate 3-epimerase